MYEKLKYEIKKDNRLGRYLVAGKNLKKGSLIFSDIPLVIGPKPDSVPVCLGCHSSWNRTYYCSKCGWPCCDSNCEKKYVHREYECKIFAEAGTRFLKMCDKRKPCAQYDCITPLRLMLTKEKYPEKWNKEIEDMEDHREERCNLTTWEIDDINIVKYLLGPCKLENKFSEDFIQRACGILEVNALEVPLKTGPNIRGIYPQVSIMSHNCVPTIVHTIVSGGKKGTPQNLVQVWAANDIKKGEKLELCYTDVFHCTLQRRALLKRSKFFDCCCERCADPSELGTNMSSLKCNMCENGTVLTTNPLDNTALWKCSHCKYFTTGETVLQLISVIQRELSESELIYGNSVEKIEQDSLWCCNILHQEHAVLLLLKYDLVQMYGRMKDYVVEENAVSFLQRKMVMCQEILNVLDIISPGLTRARGKVLLEMFSPMIILSKRKLKKGVINKTQSNEEILKASIILKEAADILIREDESSEMGMMGRNALSDYEELRLKISD